MKYRIVIIICFLLIAVPAMAVDISEEEEGFYASVTSSAEFTSRPEFIKAKYEENDIVEDIKVSLVESVPFGFLFTFAALFINEAYQQQTLQPKMKETHEYTNEYLISIGSFAVLSTTINLLTYYNYDNKNKEENNEKNR